MSSSTESPVSRTNENRRHPAEGSGCWAGLGSAGTAYKTIYTAGAAGSMAVGAQAGREVGSRNNAY